jgi:uncharacterized damage-inducible protein DinB
VEPRLAPLYEIFKVNSRLYLNCLAGMDDERARWRLSDSTNSAAFVAYHVLESRFLIASRAGLEAVNPYAAMFEGVRSIDQVREYPKLEGLRAAWKELTGNLRARFSTITQADLDQDSGLNFPFLDDKRLLATLAFLFQHESYHIGQLAMLRKHLGLGAMQYS